MKITNLIPEYIRYIENDNLSEYEKSFPELFEHYFTYWGNKKTFSKILTKKQAKEKSKNLNSQLDKIENKLQNFGFDTTNIELILFVGQNYTNGHSFRHNGVFKVFVPIESYSTEKQILIFITHEIIHSIHYSVQPDFYFNKKNKKDHFSKDLQVQ